MRVVTRTVYGAKMQTSINLGIDHEIDTNTTLNELLNIQQGVTPTPGSVPSIQYFVIGNGGHQPVTGTDNVAYTQPIPHKTTDAACFSHVPFVLRELTNDLSAAARSQYGLRRIETHGGIDYAAYYAKRLDLSTLNVRMQHVVVDGNGNKTTQDFVPTADNLNPDPNDSITNNNVLITSSGDYVSASAIVTITFTSLDADEFRHVAQVLYGDENYAVISEIGLANGTDLQVNGPGAGGTTITYDEAIGVQINTFVATYYQLNLQNNGFSFTADVGIVEPLFASIT